MADINRSANVIINAVDGFSANMQQFIGQWGAIAGIVAGAEAAIIGMSGAAAALAVKLGGDVFDSAVTFHDAIFDIKAVAGEFGASQEEIGVILDDLALKFPLTGAQAGQAMEMIAQKGYSTAEQMRKMSEAAAILNLAVGEDMTRSAQGMIATMNAFGLSIAETDRVMNLWVATSFASSLNVRELNEAMKFAAPMAGQLGYSVETTAAALAILRDKGLDAAMAGTTFRQALANLMREMPSQREALAELGLTFADVTPKTHSLVEIIAAFEGKMITAEQAMKIFGVRQGAFALLVEDGAAKFQDMEAKITGTNAAIDAMDAKMQKWSVVMAQVAGSMDLLKNTIGKEIVPLMATWVGTNEWEGIRGIITGLTEMELKQKDFGSIFYDTVKSLQSLFDEVFNDAFGANNERLYEWLVNIAELLGTNVEVLAIWVSELAKVFFDATDSSEDLQTMLQLVNVSLLGLAGPIALIHDVFVGLWYAVELGIDTAQFAMGKFGEFMVTITLGIARAIDSLPFVDMGDKIKNLEEQLSYFRDTADNAFNSKPPELWGDNVLAAFTKSNAAIKEFGTTSRDALDFTKIQWTDIGVQAILTSQNFKDAGGSMEDLKRNSVETDYSVKQITDSAAKIAAQLKISSEDMQTFMTRVQTSVDHGRNLTDAINDAARSLGYSTDKAGELSTATGTAAISIRTAADGSVVLEQNLDKASVAAANTKQKLDAMQQFEMKIELAQFEHNLKMAEDAAKYAHDYAVTQLEWQAKLEIAEVEANAEKVKAAFESIAESVKATADASASMFGDFAEATDVTGSTWFILKDALQLQMRLQEELVDAQVALTNAQTEQIRMSIDRAKTGEAMYNVNVTIMGDTAGWMEGLMQELLKQVMIKASSEAFNCLCQG